MTLMQMQEAFAVQALTEAQMIGINKDDSHKEMSIHGLRFFFGYPITAMGAMRLVALLPEVRRPG